MELLLSAADGIGRIELAGSPQNALDSPAFADPDRLAAFFARDDIVAAVAVGRGRHFSTGADPGALAADLARGPAALAALLDSGKRALDAIRYAEVPVVAAIRGSCLGGGLEIALACHFRIASANALLGFPEAERGLLPGLGGTLLAVPGPRRAAVIELLLTGRMIRGEEAAALGLVDAAVPTPEVERRAEELARRLVSGRTRSQIRSVMTAVHNAERLPRPAALAEETRLFVALAAEAVAGGGDPP
jgi:enoyl-CoA hydratase/carnithine racemase